MFFISQLPLRFCSVKRGSSQKISTVRFVFVLEFPVMEVWPVVDRVHHSSVNICIPEQQGKILFLHSLWIRNTGRNTTGDSDAGLYETVGAWECVYLHIYELQMILTPRFTVHCVIFRSLGGRGVMRGEGKQSRGEQACPQSSPLPYSLSAFISRPFRETEP